MRFDMIWGVPAGKLFSFFKILLSEKNIPHKNEYGYAL
jgi:hypothetical protein